jgi:hypothetical protein
MMVGAPEELLVSDPASVRDFLAGSAWYVGGHPVQNTYTTISFRAYFERYCIHYDGRTCPAALDTLFSREPLTGRQRVDLLGVSTVLLVRADFPGRDLRRPPPGWRLADATSRSVTWVRRSPVPGAGRPVWASPGTSVSRVRVDDRTVRFEVRDVPGGGGTVVLSSLAWPGWATDAAGLEAPTDGYLLTLHVSPGDRGRTVTAHFSPPAWPVEVAAWWLAVAGGLGWSLLVGLRGRRGR